MKKLNLKRTLERAREISIETYGEDVLRSRQIDCIAAAIVAEINDAIEEDEDED